MRPYRLITRQGATAGASTTIYSDRAPDGCVLFVSQIHAVDETSALATSLVLGVENMGTLYPMAYLAGAVAAGKPLALECMIMLAERDRLYATFNNATAGDILQVVGHGILLDCCDKVRFER